MKHLIVVGSGAGGAAAALKLQGRFDVTVLEAGREFKPFSSSLKIPEAAKKAGWLFDPREIRLLFPAMRIDKAGDGLIHVRGRGTGGTTTIATANALRLDGDLKKLGIDLDQEFEELTKSVPISTAHKDRWRRETVRLFEACREMGLEPFPTPKMGRFESCRNCGRCVLGCPHGVKWDSRAFLGEAAAGSARIVTGAEVERVIIKGGEARGVSVKRGGYRRLMAADGIVLAAGGLGTPAILQNSGFAVEPRLFVDPVLCLAARVSDAGQNTELPMPFIVERDGYILSPYFDHLSYFFHRDWRPPGNGILSLMIKLADDSEGSVDGGRIQKRLTPKDRRRMAEAADLAVEIFARRGIKRGDIFPGILNAGHPGGMFPLTAAEVRTLHHDRLPGNLAIADSSLFPASLGRPPILTIMALAWGIARRLVL